MKKDADQIFSRIDHGGICIKDSCLTQEDLKIFSGQTRIRLGLGDGTERQGCNGDGYGTCRVLKYDFDGNAIFSEGGYMPEFGEMSTRDFLMHFTPGCPNNTCEDNLALLDEQCGKVPYDDNNGSNSPVCDFNMIRNTNAPTRIA
jgi:hypothetical protein